MKKYIEFIKEKILFINVDYKIILKDLKDNPKTLITDFKIVKTENGKSEIRAKGYSKENGGWKSFDDENDNKTRKVWHKYFQNGSKKIKLITEDLDFEPGENVVCIAADGVSNDAAIKLKNGEVYEFIKRIGSQQILIRDIEGNEESFFTSRFMPELEYNMRNFNV